MMSNLPLMLPAYAEILLLVSACVILIADLFIPDKRRDATYLLSLVALLLAAFVVCAYAAAMSVAGARRRSRALVESGTGAFYLVTAIMAAASAVIVYSFVTDDFSIRFVRCGHDTHIFQWH